ncbi:MAG TPA: hypothetical protein VF170_09085 [Planctomycetaceae bacterium]
MSGPTTTIHFASATRPDGEVYRGPRCSKEQAVAWRRLGRDVVICGDDAAENERLARDIEEAVSGAGNVKRHPGHTATAGPRALPHYQPLMRPPDGHTFFETRSRKAAP